jgi:hypothetical protein
MHDPLEKKPSWTMDDSTVASNPGQLEASAVCWLWHKPLWPFIWAGGLVGSLLLAIFVHWSFGFLAAFFALANFFYWMRIKEQFRSGCANPGVIVSLYPTLLAVSTDLTKGIGHYPVIKIMKTSLSKVAGQPVEIGTRVPTVAVYQMGMDEKLPHWVDFFPQPVDFVTSDPAVVKRVLNTFTANDWQELEDWLKQMPQPYRPGLYFVLTGTDTSR